MAHCISARRKGSKTKNNNKSEQTATNNNSNALNINNTHTHRGGCTHVCMCICAHFLRSHIKTNAFCVQRHIAACACVCVCTKQEQRRKRPRARQATYNTLLCHLPTFRRYRAHAIKITYIPTYICICIYVCGFVNNFAYVRLCVFCKFCTHTNI